jgi:hypothetical protein
MQLTYVGSGAYRILVFNNQTDRAYNCDYDLYKNGSFVTSMNASDGNEMSAPYVSVLGAADYTVEIIYYDGPYPGTNGVEIERLNFTIAAQPSVPAGMLGFYGYYNSTNGQHIYTTDWEELGGNSLNFNYYATLGYIYPSLTSAPGLHAIYRYYNASTGSHYTTAVLGTYVGFVYEKILGYASIAATSTMTKGLSRWYAPSDDDHFVCVPPVVPISAGYTADPTFIIGYAQ